MPSQIEKIEPLPFDEALVFFREKITVSGEVAKTLSDSSRQKAFFVSGVTKQDELSTVMKSINRALEEGTTFEQFKKDSAEILTNRGFAGHRVKNIFQNNIQSAFQAGRFSQMQEVSELLPFWFYTTVDDSRRRVTHGKMHGIVHRSNHEFWAKSFPPNGHFCRCGVRPLTEEQVKARGLVVSRKDKSPSGFPDKGFGGNPFLNPLEGLTPQNKDLGFRQFITPETAESLKRKPLSKLAQSEKTAFTGNDLATTKRQGIDDFLDVFGARDKNVFFRDKSGEPVQINRALFIGTTRHRNLKLMAKTIKNPHEIWMVPTSDRDGNVELARRFVRVFKQSGKPDKTMVVEYAKKYWTGGQTTKKQGDKLRTGILLFGE